MSAEIIITIIFGGFAALFFKIARSYKKGTLQRDLAFVGMVAFLICAGVVWIK